MFSIYVHINRQEKPIVIPFHTREGQRIALEEILSLVGKKDAVWKTSNCALVMNDVCFVTGV